jgi:nicotinamide riboside kinase
MKIALLGAESTGKTQLSLALRDHYLAQGRRAAVVPEYLREWCAREQRTPRPEEQMPIALEQERRADEAAAAHDIAICDTSSLMAAVYSAMLFEDGSLYRFALERQRSYDVTLVTGLDLPWVADGLFRDGDHVRGPVDALVREALAKAGVDFRVVYGSGAERLHNALYAIDSIAARASGVRPAGRFGLKSGWKWSCDKCSDPECEHRLFTGL